MKVLTVSLNTSLRPFYPSSSSTAASPLEAAACRPPVTKPELGYIRCHADRSRLRKNLEVDDDTATEFEALRRDEEGICVVE